MSSAATRTVSSSPAAPPPAPSGDEGVEAPRTSAHTCAADYRSCLEPPSAAKCCASAGSLCMKRVGRLHAQCMPQHARACVDSADWLCPATWAAEVHQVPQNDTAAVTLRERGPPSPPTSVIAVTHLHHHAPPSPPPSRSPPPRTAPQASVSPATCSATCQGSTCADFYGKLTCESLGVLRCPCSDCCTDTLGAHLPPMVPNGVTPAPTPTPEPTQKPATPATCDCSWAVESSCRLATNDGTYCWGMCCTGSPPPAPWQQRSPASTESTAISTWEGTEMAEPPSAESPGAVGDGRRAPITQQTPPPAVSHGAVEGQSALASLTGGQLASGLNEQMLGAQSSSDEHSDGVAAPLFSVLGIAVVAAVAAFFVKMVRRRLTHRSLSLGGPRHRAVPVQDTVLRLPDSGRRGPPPEISMGLLVPDSVDPVVQEGGGGSFEMVPVPVPTPPVTIVPAIIPVSAPKRSGVEPIVPVQAPQPPRMAVPTADEARKIRLPAAPARARVGPTPARIPPPATNPSRVPRLPAEVSSKGFELD